ncbi:methyl-accepting chemotaxis protein [Gracilibacillus boraciitolerans]|nr:methyl-accepting chemotaxis protein [Gracilibacillus boraciitolerans]
MNRKFNSVFKKINIKNFIFRNLSIAKKYGLTLGLVFILFGLSTAVVMLLMNKTEQDIANLENRGNNAIEITELGSLIRSKGIRVVSYVQDGLQQYIDEYQTQQEEFDLIVAKLDDQIEMSKQNQLLEQVIANDQEINDIFLNSILQEKSAGNQTNAESLATQVRNIRLESLFLLEEIRKTLNEERAASVSQTKENQQLTRVVLLISMVISVIIGGLLVFFISRVISRSLNQLVDVSNRIAEGNLEVGAINYEGTDEIGRLAVAINTMSNNLRKIIYQISKISEIVSSKSKALTQSSFEVKTGSEQVSVTMQELSSGAETQANTTSDLSSSMESFMMNLQKVSTSGEQMNTSSNDVLTITEKGGQLMEESALQMNLIDQIFEESVKKVQGLDIQSQEISKLISVIKNIAEQTNLLALNASIEAARAGEHGRGFAVVADEVRKLAEQVSTSVTDITKIVGSIQAESALVTQSLQGGYKEVEKGTEQMKSTGEAFSKINQSMKQMVTNIKVVTENLSMMLANSQDMNVAVEEIAAVSEEAAAGIEQSSASSQQTNSSMEEVANNAAELSKIATELNALVRQFKH